MPPLPTLKILYHAFSGMARDRRYRSLAKTGRPLKEKTVLSHNVKVRLDDETHDRLLIYCGKNHVKKTGRKPQIISDTEKTEYRRNGSEYFRKHLERAWNFQK